MKLTKGEQQSIERLYPNGLGHVKQQYFNLYKQTMQSEIQNNDAYAATTWYSEALNICLRLNRSSDYQLPNIVCAMSHLSPRLSWARNIEALERLAEGAEKPSWLFRDSWERATVALTSENPTATFSKRAEKTRQFAKAILGDIDACVIDTHMIHASMQYTMSYCELTQTDFTACTKVLTPILQELSVALNEVTPTVQAAVWIAHKLNKGTGR